MILKKKWQGTKKHENYSVGKELKRYFFYFQSKREFLEKYGSLPPRYDASLEVVNDYDSFIPGRKLIQYMTR